MSNSSSSIRSKQNHHTEHSGTGVHFLCASMPVAVRSSLIKGGHEIINVRKNLSVCCAHKGKTHT